MKCASNGDITEGQSWCTVCPLKKGQGDKPLKLLTIYSVCMCVCEVKCQQILRIGQLIKPLNCRCRTNGKTHWAACAS